MLLVKKLIVSVDLNDDARDLRDHQIIIPVYIYISDKLSSGGMTLIDLFPTFHTGSP